MIYDLGAQVLAVIEAAYATAGVDLPDRRYVTAGAVAYDCEQLVVSLTRMYPGIAFLEDPAAPVLKATLLRSVTFAVHLVRCIPTLTEGKTTVWPTPAALNASGEQILQDAYLLPTSVVKAWHDGSLSSACDTLGIREAIPAEPMGGFGGMILAIDAQF